MSKAPIVFLFLLLFLTADAIAQRKFTEGTLTYNISITGLKGEPSPGFNGATLFVYLKPALSRTDMVSSLGTEINTYDSRAGKGFLLREYSGQKLMITMSKVNWNQKNQMYNNLVFTVGEGITEINGQKCKKAEATLSNGKSIMVFFNPEIEIINKEYSSAFNNLPGLPVQYEMQSGNLIFKYTLNNISWDPIPAAKFDSPKTGYRIMSYDENQQLKKGG